MVLYRVFQEAALTKYYSTIFSKATLFQAVIYVLMIIPPFFIAYATNDFWHYTSSYKEQPRVEYLDQLVVQVGSGQNTTSWSSFGSISLNTRKELQPDITFNETDRNGDTLSDLLSVTISFTGLGHNVQTVQVLLFFQVDFNRFGFLEQFSRVTLQSLTYTSESWAVPASELWLSGGLELTQTQPLPASGVVEDYNEPPVNSSSNTAEDTIPDILNRYNQKNVRVTWDTQYAVWTNGPSDNFTIQFELQYPPFTVTYQPNFWQYLKFAWVQYLAVFILFWWVLTFVQSFVFENQVILTIKKDSEKLHTD